MKIPCPECGGKGYKDFYGSVHTRDWCTDCGATGKIEFVGKPRDDQAPEICTYCNREDCASLFGSSLCGPIEAGKFLE